MTKISKIPLRNDLWNRIFNLFVSTLAGQNDEKKLTKFVDDFFSPTEKIMFSKRLAAAVLIAKGHDYKSIEEILRISSPTIAKLSLKVKYGDNGLNSVIKDIFNKEAQQIIWKEIEDLFDLPVKGNLKSPERFKRKYQRLREIEKIKSEF